jgi:hypothetical protein
MKLGPGLIASITTDFLAILASNWGADEGCWADSRLGSVLSESFQKDVLEGFQIVECDWCNTNATVQQCNSATVQQCN